MNNVQHVGGGELRKLIFSLGSYYSMEGIFLKYSQILGFPGVPGQS